MLRNTLSLVETKGESTKVMADCLRFVDRMIAEEQAKLKEAETNDTQNVDKEN